MLDSACSIHGQEDRDSGNVDEWGSAIALYSDEELVLNPCGTSNTEDSKQGVKHG
jgi:hypothetical protein